VLDANFRFHHLGVAVPDMAAAIPIYKDLFGYQLTSGPFDDPTQKVSVCFLSRDLPGDMTIELVAPLGADSPVRRTLQQGQSAYHVCYEVIDIDATIKQLTGKKCILLSAPVPAVAFAQKRIAWISTPTRQLIELLEA
jgi:methylmalonyl-CoA/ethylmalonyl-CoA epimerase